MIVLITGAPGSGKTLWTLPEVEKLRAESSRPVHYHHIPELKREGWTEFTDVKTAHDLPTGSIIVIDEAHQAYPQRRAGNEVPAHIAPFDQHRHRGHDFYLITQHPTELDHYIRRRVGRHIHLERQFGIERARKFEWQKLGDPGDFHSKQEAAASEFLYPKDVYSWYKSSDMHTVKKRLPWIRLGAIAGGAVFAVSVCIWVITSSLAPDKPDAPEALTAPAQTNPVPNIPQPQLEALEWSAQFVERVEGQPHSPKFYDASLRPATLPKISGCGMIETPKKSRCWCNTQQGTILTTISDTECRFYLANGWFDPTKPDEESEEKDTSANGGALASGTPPAPPPVDLLEKAPESAS